MPVKYVKHKLVMLKQHSELNEKWVQARIASDPGLLGLGEIDGKDMERPQPPGGRFDLLLYDSLANTRYEVELQLGPLLVLPRPFRVLNRPGRRHAVTLVRAVTL